MVSSTSLSSKNANVSYAERVKQALALHTPNSSLGANHLDSASAIPSVPFPELTASTSTDQTRAHPRARNKSQSLHPPSPSHIHEPHRDAHVHVQTTPQLNRTPRSDTSPPSASHQSPTVVNVWAARMKGQQQQQHHHKDYPTPDPAKADDRAQPGALPSSSSFRPHDHHHDHHTSDSSVSPQPSLQHPLPHSHSPERTAQSAPPQAAQAVDDESHADPAENHDPFVVRMPPHLRSSPAGSLSPPEDLRSWPTLANTENAHKSQNVARGVNGFDAQDLGDRGDPNAFVKNDHRSRIPPSHGEGRPRSRSQQGPGWQLGSASERQSSHSRGSGHSSRRGSRNPSTRNSSVSHSAAHSRVSSRAGSSHSSPRMSAISRASSHQELHSYHDVHNFVDPRRLAVPHPELVASPPNGPMPLPIQYVFPPAGVDPYRPQSRSPMSPPLQVDKQQPSPHRSITNSPSHYSFALPAPAPGAVTPSYSYSHSPHHGSSGSATPYMAYAYPYPPYGYPYPYPYWPYESAYVPPPDLLQQQYNQPSSSSDSSTPGHQIPTDDTSSSQVPETHAHESETPESLSNGRTEATARHHSEPVVFGSVKLPEDVSTSTLKEGEVQVDTSGITEQVASIAIGFPPGEAPRTRSRGRSVRSTSSPLDELPFGAPRHVSDTHEAGEVQSSTNGYSSTSPQTTRWKFGTLTPKPPEAPMSATIPEQPASQNQPPELAPSHQRETPIYPSIASSTPYQSSVALEPAMTNGYHDHHPSATDALPSPHRSETSSSTSDVWEVRDFGYGFGDASGSGRAPEIAKEERLARQRQREEERREFDKRRWQDADAYGGPEGRWEPEYAARPYGRPRRGSWTGPSSYVHDRGYTNDRGGHGDRGGFGGYRRGGGRGYERGYGGRGGYGAPRGRGNYRHSFSSSMPSGQFKGSPSMDYSNGYYGAVYGPRQRLPSTSESAALPVPIKSGVAQAELDPTRYTLLRQLEYYLSTENMSKDMYLRQQMDSEGWISIALFASFNRVKQMTTLPELLPELLETSSKAEVHASGDYVRMAGGAWKPFLAQDPPLSPADATKPNGLDAAGQPEVQAQKPAFPQTVPDPPQRRATDSSMSSEGDVDDESYDDEDDEDDVEFVL